MAFFWMRHFCITENMPYVPALVSMHNQFVFTRVWAHAAIHFDGWLYISHAALKKQENNRDFMREDFVDL